MKVRDQPLRAMSSRLENPVGVRAKHMSATQGALAVLATLGFAGYSFGVVLHGAIDSAGNYFAAIANPHDFQQSPP